MQAGLKLATLGTNNNIVMVAWSSGINQVFTAYT